MLKPLAFFFSLLLLTACSSYQDAGVVYHQNFDFSAVKNYSFYERNSSFTESQNLLDVHRNAIEIAIENAMAKNHFNYASLEQADIVITYHVLNGNRQEFSKYNKVIQFCNHCLRASAWQTDNIYKAPRFGSLVLDIIDPKKHRSVWRSTYPLEIKGEDNSAISNEKIQQAIAAMLAQYPIQLKNRKQTN